MRRYERDMDTEAEENADDKPTGWRGSAEVWREAAQAALVEGGIDAVKIQPLAAQLQLSRTSFYWFFKDRQALLDALLMAWEETTTGAIVTAAEAHADTITEAVLTLIAVFLADNTFDARLGFAVRSWAQQDARVMARVNAADAARLEAIRGMFDRHGFDSAEADVRARTIYLVQIGYISMQVQETLPTRLARIPAYVKTYTGQVPSPRDLKRFHARLGVSSQ